MINLWASSDVSAWQHALARYVAVIAGQQVAKLDAHDAWYREELAPTVRARTPMHITLDEMVRVTEWKMARGVWRAPNLVLVRGNTEAFVGETSMAAFALVPHFTKPIAMLATLAGVGPATASAVFAAVYPELYPFFDEQVAEQIAGLGEVKWTLGYYAKYATRLRERAQELGGPWTPVMVERALWANVGGKAGV